MTKAKTKGALINTTVSDDELHVTFEGESSSIRLEKTMFYGGRYDAAGIPAATLFDEILNDVDLPPQGDWNYILGDPACVVSDELPLWTANKSTLWDMSPSLANVKVHVPIPPMTHREALTMLASYTGSYLLHTTEGVLKIRHASVSPPGFGSPSSLGLRLDYHIDIDRTYDKPVTLIPSPIGKIKGSLKTVAIAESATTILDTTIEVTDLDSQLIVVTHDACVEGSIALTGADLIGTPEYSVYRTRFNADPTASTVRVVITGKALTVNERAFSKSYDATSGETVEFTNALTSNPVLTAAMYDRYHAYATATAYRVAMRDDPAIEIGDRLYLDTLKEPNGFGVVVAEINRSFNGGMDGEYTVITDPYI